MPITTKEAKPCAICNGTIPPGSIARPAISTDGVKRIDFAHIDCLAADDERVPICKHWQSKGVCVYESTCVFRHPEALRLTSDRARTRHGTWMRRRIFNEGRCGVLRRWLIEVFGYEYLRSGSGIIDVAGGKGELSFEFVNLSDIPCTVFDPRPLELNRYRRKLDFGFYHNNDVLGAYNILLRPDNFALHMIPRHVRLFFEMPFHLPASLLKKKKGSGEVCHDCTPVVIVTDATSHTDSSASSILNNQNVDSYRLPVALQTEGGFLAAVGRASRIAWTNKGLTHEEEEEEQNEDGDGEKLTTHDNNRNGDDATELQVPLGDLVVSTHEPPSSIEGGSGSHISDDSTSVRVDSNNEITDYYAILSVLAECSIIVGMHADQVINLHTFPNKYLCLPICIILFSYILRRRLSILSSSD